MPHLFRKPAALGFTIVTLLLSMLAFPLARITQAGGGGGCNRARHLAWAPGAGLEG
jgi:hypothetical protein